MDKISAFEDRLRLANSCVLYPNILGAKMREAFEQGRRRRETQEEGGNNTMPWFVYCLFTIYDADCVNSEPIYIVLSTLAYRYQPNIDPCADPVFRHLHIP